MNEFEMLKEFYEQWCEKNGQSKEANKDLEAINKYLNNLCEESDDFMSLLSSYADSLQEQAFMGGFKMCYQLFCELSKL